jgi:hypothetical protein
MTLTHFVADFAAILSELSAAKADFLVVGAHARAAYGEPRATKDFDVWVRATPENAARVWRALIKFGAPLLGVTESDFAAPGATYQIGVPPRRIDILTELTGLTFEDAWQNRTETDFGSGKYPVIGKREYVINKRATGRPQDLADAEHVERSPIQ